MIKTYTYRITGTAANAQTWETSGKVSCELHKVFDQALLDTFGQLTQGRAVYGQPGVGLQWAIPRAQHPDRTGAAMIANIEDMLAYLAADDIKQAERHVYKYTDCGAWIEFTPDGIKLGSIVEGCDFGTAIYPLSYPFSEEDYSVRIQAIEAEAAAIWDWANVTYDRLGRHHRNGKTPAEWGMDAPDIALDYAHLGQAGRSA